MPITHTLRSFHLQAQVYKQKLGNGYGDSREAWQLCEKEYFEKYGKNRYNSYESFKVCHHNWRQNLINNLKNNLNH